MSELGGITLVGGINRIATDLAVSTIFIMILYLVSTVLA